MGLLVQMADNLAGATPRPNRRESAVTVAEYIAAIKERLVTDPLIRSFVIGANDRHRSTALARRGHPKRWNFAGVLQYFRLGPTIQSLP